MSKSEVGIAARIRTQAASLFGDGARPVVRGDRGCAPISMGRRGRRMAYRSGPGRLFVVVAVCAPDARGSRGASARGHLAVHRRTGEGLRRSRGAASRSSLRCAGRRRVDHARVDSSRATRRSISGDRARAQRRAKTAAIGPSPTLACAGQHGWRVECHRIRHARTESVGIRALGRHVQDQAGGCQRSRSCGAQPRRHAGSGTRHAVARRDRPRARAVASRRPVRRDSTRPSSRSACPCLSGARRAHCFAIPQRT